MENESPEILEKIIRKRLVKKEWRRKNPKKVALMAQKWRERNPDYYREHHKQYVINNPTKIKEIKDRYYAAHKEQLIIEICLWKEKNKEKCLEYRRKSGKKWRTENPEKARAQQCKYGAKYRLNPQVKLHSRIAGGVGKSLKGNKQGHSWEQLVGYTCEELRVHLEKLFLPGMTWENMGEWHIDHKIPVSVFNFQFPTDPDFRKCWALKNLQPLWRIDNIKKSNNLNRPHQPSLTL